jgi:hypothetical protein
MIDLRFLDTFCSLFPDRLGGLNSRGLLGGFLRDRRLKRAGKERLVSDDGLGLSGRGLDGRRNDDFML